MKFSPIIDQIQSLLRELKLDGWMIYDFQKRNFVAVQFLEIPDYVHLTRRMVYWIPAVGEPVKLVSVIEPHYLDHLPGSKIEYLSWKDFESALGFILKDPKKIAMEYSHNCAIPYQSIVDAGFVDLIRTFGANVVSSSVFIQEFTCVLNQKQRQLHTEAASLLDFLAEDTWNFISRSLRDKQVITEYHVQQRIKEKFRSSGFVSEGDPICAVNENSSNPHYCPSHQGSKLIKENDFILIDLWCKKNEINAVYADISRVAVASSTPTDLQNRVFSIVRKAQKAATDFISENMKNNKIVKGCQADLAARTVIIEEGYGDYFIHRTGHNIFIQDHGPGTHLDSVETCDDRAIVPGTCFSVEPGIYLPNRFGVRLEYDILTSKNGVCEITGGVQDEIKTLL
jgi:Xaa-Pro aminopeptidase